MTQRCLIWAAVSTELQAKDDKTSLAEQERQARTVAEANGWRVVDVLRVPGHSRRYIDIHEMNQDMLKEGIDAFQRLMDHWRACDFDILIVRDGNRFARTQTLHAYVTERTIDAGAVIYSLSDGLINEQNYRMWIAMNGYSAATQMDNVVKAAAVTKDKRASEGIWHSGRPPWFLEVERTEYGRAIRTRINRAYERLYTDLAALILEGVSWRHIERDLWQRFGHGKYGKKWPRYAMYHAVWHPYWWGHSARTWQDGSGSVANGQRKGLWMIDAGEPLPSGVRIWHNTHDPVWSGDLADRIKAELRVRYNVLRGNALVKNRHKFTGLLICAECEHYMVYDGGNSICCRSKYSTRGVSKACDRSHCIAESKVQAYLTPILQRMIDLAAPDLLAQPDQADDAAVRVAAIEGEIASIEDQVRRLILKQAAAPDTLATLYDEQIITFADQLDALRGTLASAQRELNRQQPQQLDSAFMELTSFDTLEAFWASGDTRVNQILHRLIGSRRLVVWDNEIIGTALK